MFRMEFYLGAIDFDMWTNIEEGFKPSKGEGGRIIARNL